MTVWCGAMRVRYMRCATVAVVTLLAVPGCSKVVTGNATRDVPAPRRKPTDCEQVSAPLTPIDPRAAGEPQLKIPQPPGWERAPMLDSEVLVLHGEADELLLGSGSVGAPDVAHCTTPTCI